MIDTRSGGNGAGCDFPHNPGSQSRTICCPKYRSVCFKWTSTRYRFQLMLSSPKPQLYNSGFAGADCHNLGSSCKSSHVPCATPTQSGTNILQHMDVVPLPLLVSCSCSLCELAVYVTLSSFLEYYKSGNRNLSNIVPFCKL